MAHEIKSFTSLNLIRLRANSRNPRTNSKPSFLKFCSSRITLGTKTLDELVPPREERTGHTEITTQRRSVRNRGLSCSLGGWKFHRLLSASWGPRRARGAVKGPETQGLRGQRQMAPLRLRGRAKPPSFSSPSAQPSTDWALPTKTTKLSWKRPQRCSQKSLSRLAGQPSPSTSK